MSLFTLPPSDLVLALPPIRSKLSLRSKREVNKLWVQLEALEAQNKQLKYSLTKAMQERATIINQMERYKHQHAILIDKYNALQRERRMQP